MTQSGPKPVVSLLLIVIGILTAHAIWQQRRLHRLDFDLSYQQRHMEEQASLRAANKLEGQRADLIATIQWLDDYYRSDEGLHRSGGLLRSDQKTIDAEAIGAWVFDVYLNARLHGRSDAEARQMVKDAIEGSAEWHAVHARR